MSLAGCLIALTIALFAAAWTGHLSEWVRVRTGLVLYAAIFGAFAWSIGATITETALIVGVYASGCALVLWRGAGAHGRHE